MFCKYCGEKIDDTVIHCPWCGKKVHGTPLYKQIKIQTRKRFCENCGEELYATDRYCPYCGYEVNDIPPMRSFKKINTKMKKEYKWYGLFLMPIIIFFIILLKVNSIQGHWYLANADVFYFDSGGLSWYYGFYPEIFFNSNGSYSQSDNGSILGTYEADNGILTLYDNHYSETNTYAYKIKWGKLYIYEGNKEYIYARRITVVEPEGILQASVSCNKDKDIFLVYNTDIEEITFVTDNSQENPQYRYGICISLKTEKEEEFAEFLTEHARLSHNDFMVNSVAMDQSFPLINGISSDGSFFIAYFDNETDAREYYNSLK